MENEKKQLFLPIPGGRVPVGKEVYDAWWQAENKEDYFLRRIKEERFVYDPEKRIATFYPGREDSVDRLMEEGVEFATKQSSVEHQVEVRILLETILARLSEPEKHFMRAAFFSDLSETEVSKELNIPLTTLRNRKEAFIRKCGKILRSKRIWNDGS